MTNKTSENVRRIQGGPTLTIFAITRLIIVQKFWNSVGFNHTNIRDQERFYSSSNEQSCVKYGIVTTFFVSISEIVINIVLSEWKPLYKIKST
jgi:hypothetical protein